MTELLYAAALLAFTPILFVVIVSVISKCFRHRPPSDPLLLPATRGDLANLELRIAESSYKGLTQQTVCRTVAMQVEDRLVDLPLWHECVKCEKPAYFQNYEDWLDHFDKVHDPSVRWTNPWGDTNTDPYENKIPDAWEVKPAFGLKNVLHPKPVKCRTFVWDGEDYNEKAGATYKFSDGSVTRVADVTKHEAVQIYKALLNDVDKLPRSFDQPSPIPPEGAECRWEGGPCHPDWLETPPGGFKWARRPNIGGGWHWEVAPKEEGGLYKKRSPSKTDDSSVRLHNTTTNGSA